MRVRIEPGLSPAVIDAKIEIDGHDVAKAVRGLRLDLRVGEVPTILLDVVAIPLEPVEVSHATVYLPAETHELLVRLGWTPPPLAK